MNLGINKGMKLTVLKHLDFKHAITEIITGVIINREIIGKIIRIEDTNNMEMDTSLTKDMKDRQITLKDNNVILSIRLQPKLVSLLKTLKLELKKLLSIPNLKGIQ